LSENDKVDVFSTRAEKKTLMGQRAVRVAEERGGSIRLIPIEIEKCSLSGLKCLPKETDQLVPGDASPDDFWKAFDRALTYSVSL